MLCFFFASLLILTVARSLIPESIWKPVKFRYNLLIIKINCAWSIHCWLNGCEHTTQEIEVSGAVFCCRFFFSSSWAAIRRYDRVCVHLAIVISAIVAPFCWFPRKLCIVFFFLFIIIFISIFFFFFFLIFETRANALNLEMLFQAQNTKITPMYQNELR